MSKLKRLINQLSDKDLHIIHENLRSCEAHKSAELLKLFREGKLSDPDIKASLDVNNNAFYTLRSRLNEKIESYFLEQSDTPRTVLLQQVAAIGEIVLSQNKTIAVATLKKLEKELQSYDLSNELTQVYKALKKLSIHSPESFEYSQLYNKHVAYMLAQDKAEDMLVDYFKRYNDYLHNYEEPDSMSLGLIVEKLEQNSQLYQSHRLNVYYQCVSIFHKLYVEPIDIDDKKALKEMLKIFDVVQNYFDIYRMDPTYHSLKWVFLYLQMLLQYRYNKHDKVDEIIRQLNPIANHLLVNYSLYTSSSYFLFIKLERAIALGTQRSLASENAKTFKNFEVDKDDVGNFLAYTNYRALCLIYAGKQKEAANLLNEVLGTINTKDHVLALLDTKLFLATTYFISGYNRKTTFILNNVQRQIRLLGKENCEHTYYYMKVIKSSLTELAESKKEKKIQNYSVKFEEVAKPFNSPLRFIDTAIFELEKVSVSTM